MSAQIRIKKIVALTFILPLWAILSPDQAGGQNGLDKPSGNQSRDVDNLPEGEGRKLLFEACVQCHDFKNIVSQRKTLSGWRRTVNEMIWRGAPLMEAEAQKVVNYLTASFGLDKPVAESREMASKDSEDDLEQYLPEGKGRAIVLQSCVRCHDLRKIVSRRKRAAWWRRTVDQMIRLGARLGADEAETIGNYLAASFGTDKPLPDALKKSVPQDSRRQSRKVTSPKSQ